MVIPARYDEEPSFTRQQRFELEALRIKERARIIAHGFRLGAVVLVVYFSSGALRALAGQITIADVAVKLLANEAFSNVSAWLVGLGGVGFGWRERRLRHRDTKRMGERLRELETSKDPRRSSSKLTSQGDYREGG